MISVIIVVAVVGFIIACIHGSHVEYNRCPKCHANHQWEYEKDNQRRICASCQLVQKRCLVIVGLGIAQNGDKIFDYINED